MAFLINPNTAYLLIAACIVCFVLSQRRPSSIPLKILLAVCLAGAGYNLFQLRWNPWGLMLTAAGPLMYTYAARQPLEQIFPRIITILVLAGGPVVLFWTAPETMLMSYELAIVISLLVSRFLYYTLTNIPGAPPQPDIMAGLPGICRTEIEPYNMGYVEVEGEYWLAKCKTYVPVGSPVRVIKHSGPVLFVKLMEDYTKNKKRGSMPFEQHQEKLYSKDAASIYQAALKATEKLEGKLLTSSPEKLKFEARFPKVILGKTLGERTQLSCEIRQQDGNCLVIVDAFPLDALERKLMFGARKGVTLTVVTWFVAHLEHNLGIASK